VPLSEEEQRILQEMEQKLYADDRGLASQFAHRHGGHRAGRSCRWAALCFVAGFVLLLLTFRSSLVLGSAGFVVMLFSALFFERNLRQLDGPFFGSFSRAFRRGGLGGEISDFRQRIRQHFKHQD
jgi:hypothetical protein